MDNQIIDALELSSQLKEICEKLKANGISENLLHASIHAAHAHNLLEDELIKQREKVA